MVHGDVLVKSNRLIALDTYEMVLAGDLVQHIQLPGQFVHVKIGEGSTHMLRRPFSIADYNPETNEFVLVYKLIGEGTTWLSQLRMGDSLDVLGPLGNGFQIQGIQKQRILVVGGGVGVPPLYNLVKQLSAHNQVTAILGYQSIDSVFYEEEFNKWADVHIATDDGSYGSKGFVTDVINQLNLSVDQYFSCGPLGMLRSVQNNMEGYEGFLSVEERMGCGVGACFACVCPAKNEKGYVKICQDGPVFDAREVTL
ncbi:dihydroorotate dehydrogenase electron transfer subunit [Aquisalibacillus elongatus]|uniref:Dihydroorotate dehydrogenase B (NAD(+)), electron transfer subunit n=1 Tax=Aquisalibacillus elongatus TaxID=485577 RepID=A0A3N5CBD4_9BACI|nr:dihydroorotate dehydrogenase electron transfer subunit [Aquisalibacillus elongatus]RPF56055.1 dihydroorotate oxidase B electron transfer subunit [Aquisalibacillus elongatus]